VILDEPQFEGYVSSDRTESEDDFFKEEKKQGDSREDSDADENKTTPKQFKHRYVVDLVATFKDHNSDLILHWSLAKKHPGEWTKPDD